MMGMVQDFEQVLRYPCCELRRQPLSAGDFGYVLAIHVLHYDVEVVRHLASFIDCRDALVDCGKLLLELSPEPLRIHNLQAVRIEPQVNELQRDAASAG